MKHQRKKILVVLGTRPEAVKLAPVILALRSAPEHFQPVVVLTSQHRTMAREVLEMFSIVPDVDLGIMRRRQTPSTITCDTIRKIGPVCDAERPDLVMVQGDTTSAMAAALEAFHRRIPVAHVEAGLRTDDRYNPFPEEINRRLISQLASLHFAATENNRSRLIAEGVPPDTVFVTGNPVIDALRRMSRMPLSDSVPDFLRTPRRGARYLLLTTHRRESFGEGQRNIFEAINRIVERHPDVEIIFPIHPNPSVTAAVKRHLAAHPRVHLVPPMDYATFVQAMRRSHIVLTDSGGVQEEAPALGRPVVILRRETERDEIIRSGNGVLAGTSQRRIIEAVESLLNDPGLYKRMSGTAFPFGRGGAAGKIVAILKRAIRK